MIQNLGIKNRMPINYFWYKLTSLIILFLLISLPFAVTGNFLNFFRVIIISVGIPLAIYRWLVFRNFFFYIEDNKLTIFSGIIIKSSKTIAFNMIQNFETKSGLVANIFGLTTISIWTGSPSQIQVVNGNSRNNADIYFYIKKSDLEQIKTAIYNK